MNRIKDYKKLSEDIVQWIRQYAQDNNIKSLVVGVSGGIDSAVVSTLCAMTGLCTYCTIIPIHSNNEYNEVAKRHSDWLSSNYKKTKSLYIPLTLVYESYKALMPQDPYITNLSYVNSKARIRMTALYQIAGSTEGVVVGTGNKVEDFGVGFFTKYGDGGVDISPIADLYKTEVRELGKYLGISQTIIDADPTDGLWEDGRTDEQQIGCTYEELEEAMELGTGKGIEILNKMQRQNKHKFLPIPIYKLTI